MDEKGARIAQTSAGGDMFGDETALPGGLVYRPAFIAEDEEAALLRGIAALPLHEAQYKEYTARRRILSYGSSYDFIPSPSVPASSRGCRRGVREPALGGALLPGRVVLGCRGADPLEDYDTVHGGLVPSGLLVLALAPWIAVAARRPRPMSRTRSTTR